jgi:hypothetical protein
MGTGNHIADFDNDDPYFEEMGFINLIRCDFCGVMVDEFELNFDTFNGKNSGVTYCDDCKPEYFKWKSDPENQDNDPLKHFQTFINKLHENN